MLRTLSGHFWTVAPVARSLLRAPAISAFEPWSTTLVDPHMGPVRLTGALHAAARSGQLESDTLVVAIHGLGGDIDSHYIRTLSMCAHQAGAACLRLNLRGADMSGDDFYHAGLTADIDAALASGQLDPFQNIVIVGYSIGGHIVLRYATGSIDARVRAVAAICPPLNLAQSSTDIDKAIRTPYRRHVIAALRDMLRAIGRRRALPLPLEQALKIATIQRWDDALVAPRFGFCGAQDYYRQMSMAGRFDELRIPSLILAARHDPMVPRASLERALPIHSSGDSMLEVRWLERAGHVGFPSALDLEGQVLRWLTMH